MCYLKCLLFVHKKQTKIMSAITKIKNGKQEEIVASKWIKKIIILLHRAKKIHGAKCVRCT